MQSKESPALLEFQTCQLNERMKIMRVTYLALAAFAFAASCSKEAAEPDVYDWTDGKIRIRPSISDVAGSRAQDMTLDRLESFQVTCFDINGESVSYLSPHFEDATFIRKITPVATTYEALQDNCSEWPENTLVRFFAFSPSLADLGIKVKLTGTDKSYSLEDVRINPDISKQIDLITAEASGDRWKDFTRGVDLAFGHRLCQVELLAWSECPYFDVEIAGVRIGNPEVEGTFVFADESRSPESEVRNPRWVIKGDGIKDKVEYLYCGSGSPDTGDTVFSINSSEHNTYETAASIMGQGGCAMVIPTKNKSWGGLNDSDNPHIPYKTDKMYFSILLRASDRNTGYTFYPYPEEGTGMTVVSYAVDKNGKIKSRLYAGDKKGVYFKDADRKTLYHAENGIVVKDFGWAAIPVDVDWSAGKRYVYTLDYSKGIGLHDPSDPDPGKPIASMLPAIMGVNVENWKSSEIEDNPTIIVPGN